MLKYWEKNLIVTMGVAALALVSAQAQSESTEKKPGPASDTFGFTAGVFISNSDTDVRLGSGLGLDINLEDTLGFDSKTNVFRTEAYWRFTANHKHRVDVSWFALRRSAETHVGQDIIFTGPGGDKVTIPTGSDVHSHLNLDIFETAYSYSFLQDQRVDFAVIGGLYVMPTDFGLTSTGLIDTSRSFNFTAPLPVVGLRLDVALWPKWYFRSSSQLFALDSSGFSGRLMQMRGAVEYSIWDHFALGTGVDNMALSIDGKGAHFPGIDFRGKLDYKYTGLQVYGKLFF